jgi:hypothetical protein
MKPVESVSTYIKPGHNFFLPLPSGGQEPKALITVHKKATQ